MKAHKNHDTVEFNQVTPEELEEARLKIVDDRSQSEGRILVMRSKLAGLNTTGERIIKVRAGTHYVTGGRSIRKSQCFRCSKPSRSSFASCSAT